MDPLVATAILLGLVAAGFFGIREILVWQARRALGVRLALQSRDAPLRGVLPVQVQCRPRQEVRIERAVARTICRNKVVEHHGDHTHRESGELGRSELEFLKAYTFRPGNPEIFELEVPVADGLPTDRQGPLTVDWHLEVEFEIPDYPDLALREPIRVFRK